MQKADYIRKYIDHIRKRNYITYKKCNKNAFQKIADMGIQNYRLFCEVLFELCLKN